MQARNPAPDRFPGTRPGVLVRHTAGRALYPGVNPLLTELDACKLNLSRNANISISNVKPETKTRIIARTAGTSTGNTGTENARLTLIKRGPDRNPAQLTHGA